MNHPYQAFHFIPRFMRIIVGMILAWTSSIPIRFANAAPGDPPPGTPWTAYPDIGSCTNCRMYVWTNDAGVKCDKVVCIDPDWEQCKATGCKPGSGFNTLICGSTGLETCAYVCNTDGKGYKKVLCVNVAGSGTTTRTFCDYNAGCGVSADGFIEGKRTTIAETCWTGQKVVTKEVGECGKGGCAKKLICKPGQPCCRPGLDEGCTDNCVTNGKIVDVTPKCGPGGDGYQCTFGKVTVSVPLPCPTVVRKPFPRAIVGQPVNFAIVDGCSALPSSSNRTDIGPPYDKCGDTIFAYEGQLAWICSKPDMSDAEWTMDERSWNVDQTNPEGKILSTRTGSSVNHVYETSSYDKAPNGPGYPEMSKRQPAYQVQLKTSYSLVGAFKYHYRTQEERCYWGADGSGGRKKCHNPGDCISDPNRENREDCKPDGTRRTEIFSPTRELPSFIIGNISVTGAKTPQDLNNPNSCGVIGTPVIQSQAVLQP